MARTRIKNGGPTRGRFRLKKLGKGYSTVRKEPIGSRPVLRITDPENGGASKKDSSATKA